MKKEKILVGDKTYKEAQVVLLFSLIEGKCIGSIAVSLDKKLAACPKSKAGNHDIYILLPKKK